MHSSLRRQDKTRLSYLVGDVNSIGDMSRLFSVVLTTFPDWTKQFRNFVADSLDLSPFFFKTRESCLVLSVSAM